MFCLVHCYILSRVHKRCLINNSGMNNHHCFWNSLLHTPLPPFKTYLKQVRSCSSPSFPLSTEWPKIAFECSNMPLLTLLQNLLWLPSALRTLLAWPLPTCLAPSLPHQYSPSPGHGLPSSLTLHLHPLCSLRLEQLLQYLHLTSSLRPQIRHRLLLEAFQDHHPHLSPAPPLGSTMPEHPHHSPEHFCFIHLVARGNLSSDTGDPGSTALSGTHKMASF